MTTANFSWNRSTQEITSTIEKKLAHQKLGDEILISNIRLFIIFRWAIILGLILFQVISIVASDTLTQLGIKDQEDWPLAVTVILTIANIAYAYALDYCQPSKYNTPSTNIWVQIIIDLLCLSVVVHFVGSTETPAPFFYILHIALACIFFSTLESLFVTAIVSAMYSILLIIESGMFFQVPQSMLIDAHYSGEKLHKGHILVWMAALNTLFLTVWYVVSRLAIILRQHEQHLREAYEQIHQAQIAKDQYAMLMTHQLKAPLDAIRSKINLINGGYCGPVPTEIADVLERIDKRGSSMAKLILDVLRLERLKTAGRNLEAIDYVSISSIIDKCVEKLTPVANARQIELKLSVEDFRAHGIADQIEILIENIVSNAISYSHVGKSVEISSIVNKNQNTAVVSITDHGIGIEEKDLPNIFNEYFYSPRAVLHNQSSSGIGLSLVKIAAANNNLQLKVISEPEVGTTFSITFTDIQQIEAH